MCTVVSLTNDRNMHATLPTFANDVVACHVMLYIVHESVCGRSAGPGGLVAGGLAGGRADTAGKGGSRPDLMIIIIGSRHARACPHMHMIRGIHADMQRQKNKKGRKRRESICS